MEDTNLEKGEGFESSQENINTPDTQIEKNLEGASEGFEKKLDKLDFFNERDPLGTEEAKMETEKSSNTLIKMVGSGILTSMETLRNYENGPLTDQENQEKFIKHYEQEKILFSEVGMNALIYELPAEDNQDMLVKEMRSDRPKSFTQNPVELELDMQNELYELGISVPLPMGLLRVFERDLVKKEVRTKELVMMEKISGHSVGDHSRSHDTSEPIQLPENFNIEKFMSELTADVSKMHENGLYHKDLNINNVMVNSEGKHVIIDFGTTGYGDRENPYVTEMHDGSTINYTPDDVNLENIKNVLRKMLTSK